MRLHRIASGLKGAAARFIRAERGNVAIMYALSLPVLLTFIGAAIDYTRAVNARSAMQAAVDATALMVSKEAANISAENLKDKAKAYFNALYNHSEVGNVEIDAVYTPNTGNGASVKVDVTGAVKTDFMKYAGYSMDIGASSTTKWGNSRYRVALALDNTGSMASASKMEELKKATKQLIEDFYKMANANEDIYISIVPFAKDVNIGPDKKDVTWLNWSEWDSANKVKVCTKPEYTTKRKCDNNGGQWVSVTAPHSTWNGCVMDRTKDYDVSNVNPTNTIPDSMPLPEQYGDCPVPLLGMTSVKQSKQTLIDKVDDMSPDGNTNQAIGLAWAWLTHATDGPFPAPAKDANYNYVDAIILLTDGMNTQNRWENSHSPIDARQAIMCSNIKTTQIKLFAVQVATDGDSVSTMLKNCTSEPDNSNYFSYITQASQMTVKFKNIFEELSRLRVAS